MILKMNRKFLIAESNHETAFLFPTINLVSEAHCNISSGFSVFQQAGIVQHNERDKNIKYVQRVSEI